MSNTTMIVGIDIGGTFTDFAILNTQTGQLYIGKRLTTPEDPSRALMKGIDELCERAGIQYTDLDRVSHATTLVTNAIIERKGSKTGLLMTKGFRDTLVIGPETRYDHYDFRFERPEPLVPRHLTREVPERVAWNGEIIFSLEADAVRSAIRELLEEGIESLAVCLLHSYRNPVHEQLIQRLAAEEFPQIDCTISSEVAPEIREYDRASTTAANAYVRPRVRQYISRLDEKLREKGFRKHVHIMLSNGGISSTEVAQKVPIQLIESGPAAGALAAALYSQLLDIDRVLAFDMGGTTAKMCCIEHGEARHANLFETARAHRFKRGSGLPLLIPVIELMEIGAGGGSIACIDNLGLLKVGPTSAGAIPGPAAYGHGGEEPTVTDADMLLGYIDPHRFLGGDMVLDRIAAENAINEQIAKPLRRTPVEAAWGIFNVVNENMVAAGKRYAAERALDIRDFTLVTFGGAGPIHAWQVGRILGIKKMLFPLGAGATSAVGLCVAAPLVNLSNSYMGALDNLDWDRVSQLFADMGQRARMMLHSAGAQPSEITIDRSVDMRFSGQGYEIEVPLSGLDFVHNEHDRTVKQISEQFHKTYAHHFGRVPENGLIEAITWRLRAAGRSLSLNLEPQVPTKSSSSLHRGKRKVYFGPEHGFVSCPIFDRYLLAPGYEDRGPALIEERETTVVVSPGARWSVDSYLNLSVML